MDSLIVRKMDGTQYDLFNKNIPCTITDGNQKCDLLGEDTLNLKVKSAQPLPLSIGDICTVFGKKYYLNTSPTITKQGTRLFLYEIVFEGVQYKLLDIQYRNADTLGHNPTANFSIMVNMELAMQVLINNANRMGETWLLGDCPETEYREMSFNNENCLSVLQRLCKEFETEFEIEPLPNAYKLHIRKAGSVFNFQFTYGSNGGIYKLKRKNTNSSNVVTRLYVEGGSKNIKTGYRNNATRLRLSINEESYIEQTQAIAAMGIKEASKIFEDIYPHRTGHVTTLGDDRFSFTDSEMFDLNEKESDGVTTKWLIANTSAKIRFNKGNLSGYEFEVSRYDTETKTFKIKEYEDSRGFKMPSVETAYQIAVGDEYVLLDIIMPASYVEAAEAELLENGNTYYEQNSQPKVEYELEILPIFLKNMFYNPGEIIDIFKIGDYLPILDSDINVDKSIRVKGFTRNLFNPYKYKLIISDIVDISIIERLIDNKIETDKIININQLADISKARNNWRTSQEVLGMVFDPEGDYYTDKIKPGSIETMALSVGAKSMQFVLVNTVIQANYNGDKNRIFVQGGKLSHYTIDENSIRQWTLTNFEQQFTDTVENQTVEQTAYYIYAKCSRVTDDGLIVFSTNQIKTEQDKNYYHFWVGVVNSVDTGVRSISLLYGFTTINGRHIKTGKIESSGGSGSYFDLDENKFRIGNQNKGLSWNENNDGQLILNGTLVQSQTGETQPLGFFRGEYNDTYTYYESDEVTYQGSSYRFIYPTPQTGKVPTNTTYWILFAAKGDPGTNGEASDWKTFAYKKSATKPDSPTDTTSIPAGWQDYPDSEATDDDKWWMVVAIVHWTGTEWLAGTFVDDVFTPGQWSEPITVTGEQGTDGQYIDFKFFATSNTNAPAWNDTLASMLNPTGWSDQPPQLPSGGAIWMIEAWKQAGGTQLIASWSNPVRISGEKGQDGISPYYLDLDNENASVAADYNGNPVAATYPSCNARLYLGSEQVTNGVTFKYVVSGCTINITTGSYISNSSFTLTGISADKATVTVTARIGGNDVMSSVMSITRIKAGTPGTDAIIYWLQPSVSAIKKSASGTMTPGTITCEAFQRAGDGNIQIAQNVSIRYQLSMGSLQNYSGAITIPSNTTYIDFMLYDSGNNLLDKERIPVVADGTNGLDGAVFEYRYQKNGSPTQWPDYPNNPSGTNPSGWTTTIPSVGTLEYLWMTVAKKSAAGAILQDWSTPTRTSPVDGKDGSYTSFVFKLSRTQPETPTGTNLIPSGWVDSPTGSNSNLSDITHDSVWTIQPDGTRKSPVITHNGLTKNRINFTTSQANQAIIINLKVSSEANYDFALVGLLDNSNLSLSGNYTDRISGEMEKLISVNIPQAGTHFIEVGYGKDGSVSNGSDCAWYSISAAIWWMSKSTVSYQNGQWVAGAWSTPIKTTGEDGEAGMDGKFWDYKYMVLPTNSQPLTPTGLNPSGWSDQPPSLTPGKYLWMSYCEKNAEQTEILWGWSDPVRISGEKGDTGDTGPSVVFRGNYSSSDTYYGTAKRVDVVKYNNTYYVARVDAGNGFSGQTPTNTSYWNAFGAQFDSVATNLLLAEMANIAGFIFKNGRLISQYGTVNNIDSNDFSNANFRPNIILDGLRGAISLRGGLVDRYNVINNQNFNTYLTTISGMSNTYQLNFSLSGVKVKFEYWESGKFIYLPNDETLEGTEITFYNTSGTVLPVSGDINNKRYSEISNSSDLQTTSSFVISNKGFMRFRLYRLKVSDYPGSYGTATNGYYFRWIIVDEKTF
jgi:hypothetical protein